MLRHPPPRINDPDEIRRRVAAHGRWWHEIELAPGVVTPGDDSNRQKLPVLDELGLAPDLRGVRALDVGCSDGFFAFELERRGADVLAVDFVPEDSTGFAVAREILGSSVSYRMDSVYNLHPDRHGYFDLVLFLGVLYHLRRPMAGLDAVRSVLRPGGELFVATFLIDEAVLLPDGSTTTLAALDPRLREIPLWQAYPGGALNGDHTNCFAPNLRALEVALAEAELRVEASKALPGAGFVRAVAVEDASAAKYRDLDGRLHETPFDPSVPYFLDEAGAEHRLTGRRADNPDHPPRAHARAPWWRRLIGG